MQEGRRRVEAGGGGGRPLARFQGATFRCLPRAPTTRRRAGLAREGEKATDGKGWDGVWMVALAVFVPARQSTRVCAARAPQASVR